MSSLNIWNIPLPELYTETRKDYAYAIMNLCLAQHDNVIQLR